MAKYEENYTKEEIKKVKKIYKKLDNADKVLLVEEFGDVEEVYKYFIDLGVTKESDLETYLEKLREENKIDISKEKIEKILNPEDDNKEEKSEVEVENTNEETKEKTEKQDVEKENKGENKGENEMDKPENSEKKETTYELDFMNELEEIRNKIDELEEKKDDQLRRIEEVKDIVTARLLIAKLEEKDADDITPNENKKLKEARDLVEKFEKSEKEKVEKIENKQYKDITDEDIENLENSKKSQTQEGSIEYLSKLFNDVIKSGEEIKETIDKNAKLEAKILSHPDIKAYEREAILSEIEKERDSEIKKIRALSNQKERNTEVNGLKEVEDYIASIPEELKNNPIKRDIDSEFKRLKYQHLGIESEKENLSEEEYNDLVAESLENLSNFVKDSEDKVNKAILEEIEIGNERISEYEKTKNDLVISVNKEEVEVPEIEEQDEEVEVESESVSNFPTRKATTFWSKAKGWFSNVKDKIKGKLRERFALEEDEEELEMEEISEEELNENEVVNEPVNEPEVEINNEKLTKEEQKEVYEKVYGEDEARERIRRRIEEAKMRAELNLKNKQNQEKEKDDEIEL